VALVLPCLGPVGLIWWVWTGRSGPRVLDLLCLDDVAPWILVNSSKNKAELAKTNMNKFKTYENQRNSYLFTYAPAAAEVKLCYF
jgi:hypothetical protein